MSEPTRRSPRIGSASDVLDIAGGIALVVLLLLNFGLLPERLDLLFWPAAVVVALDLVWFFTVRAPRWKKDAQRAEDEARSTPSAGGEQVSAVLASEHGATSPQRAEAPAVGSESQLVARHAATTWRTPIVYRLFFPAIGLYFLGATVIYFDGGTDLPFTALSAVLGVVLTVGPFRPVVRLQGQTIFARGLVFSRTIPLTDLQDVLPGYGGLNLVTSDGRHFEATGVGEKWNITAWLGRRGRADDVADVLRSARDAAIVDNAR
jgi:hypothetical protein